MGLYVETAYPSDLQSEKPVDVVWRDLPLVVLQEGIQPGTHLRPDLIQGGAFLYALVDPVLYEDLLQGHPVKLVLQPLDLKLEFPPEQFLQPVGGIPDKLGYRGLHRGAVHYHHHVGGMDNLAVGAGVKPLNGLLGGNAPGHRYLYFSLVGGVVVYAGDLQPALPGGALY